ncbi:hypothetical protein J4447_01855 [Candidatus Pacearchaeota archaeon]|nr:hypothetical protein [Candidatus Pacearchaeota archaeon]
MYLKRAKSPRTWPIKRKGTKYVAVPSHNISRGLPLLIILRDYLKLGSTRREIKKALALGAVYVNGKQIKEDKYGLTLNDVITLRSGNNYEESYRLTYSDNRKFSLDKISREESNEKTSKVVGKKILKGRKIQISLLDGRTMISKPDIKIGSSVLIDLKSKKVKKVIPLQKNSEIIVISGKHIGKKGKVEEVLDEGVVRVAFGSKKIGLKLESIMALK